MQSGAPAALRGYRLQALYTLMRILEPKADSTYLFQPEGTEDLDILNSSGAMVEAIQVKSYSPLVFSDLTTGENPFFRRAAGLSKGQNQPVIKLVNFGPIGPELSQAWAAAETSENAETARERAAHQKRVASKLATGGFGPDEIEGFFASIELIALDEEEVLHTVLAQIRGLSTGVDPENAFDLFTAWYYQLAEQRQIVSCTDLVQKVNAVSKFLAERYQYHRHWHTTIKPLETQELQPQQIQSLRDEFYAGVGTRYEHIQAGLDFVREQKLAEIHRAFQRSNVVIVHAASGQGKSALAYRYLHDMYPNQWRFAVQRIQDAEQAQSIALALSGFAQAVGIPVAVYLDVHPRDIDWPELARQLASHKLLHVLVTVREEDYRRANIADVDFSFAEMGLDFDQAEARLIYERMRAASGARAFLDFDAAWGAFGGGGPLLEFVYLLTQTETLEQRLQNQVQRIENEVREQHASRDELRLLTLAAVASAYGARLRTRAVIDVLDLPAPHRTLAQFEHEYLLRCTNDGMYLEGLHPIRSEILCRLLIQPDIVPWLEIVSAAFPMLLEEDWETFILHALVDETHRPDRDAFLGLVQSVRPRTWSGVHGILRSLLWFGAQEYVAINQPMLDAAHQEMGPGWWFIADLNFASPGESPALGDWWTSLGSLIPPERQARIKAIRESQTPKDTLFHRCRTWLQLLNEPPEIPPRSEVWQRVAESWYWITRLAPEKSATDWIPRAELDAATDDLPLGTLADLSLALYKWDPEMHQDWLEAQRSVLCRRLAEQQNILALESLGAVFKIHFIPSGTVDGDASDVFHAETMARIGLVRRLFPSYESYGAQGYGFKLAGIELPQGDSTRKDGVPATYLLPSWALWLNGVVSGIARLGYRPDSWENFLRTILQIRKLIVGCLCDLNRGLIKFYRRDRAVNVRATIDAKAWQHCWEQLGDTVDLPKSAVDQWGFASETADSALLQTVQQTQAPAAIALQRYRPYLDVQREYFAALRNFLNQAPPVWVTNANVGKLTPMDPRKGNILQELHEKGVKTDPALTVLNLFDARSKLSEYQRQFRALFEQYLDADAIYALEEHETAAFSMTWALWVYYAFEPWLRAADPMKQVPQWMETARWGLKMNVQQACETMHSDGINLTMIDCDQRWRDASALWARLDVSDPTCLYSTIEAFPVALRNAIGSMEPGIMTYYLLEEVCRYVVLIPFVGGLMLDNLIWPFQTLTILRTENIQEKPWACFPHEISDSFREKFSIGMWDNPEILAANQLSRSVATLRQLTSQISEFEALPDLTEAGLKRLQFYLREEFSPMLGKSLQEFFDSAALLLECFNTLSNVEQEERNYLRTAIEVLLEVQDKVRPSEDDGVCQLDLADIVAYGQNLEESYLAIEWIRLLWIADFLRGNSQEHHFGF